MFSTTSTAGSHPDAETLAAFAEGRIQDPGRRRAVIEHVADCGACGETVADAMAFLAESEESGDDADVVPIRATAPPAGDARRGGRIPAWAWTMAAVLSLIVLGVAALLFGPQDRMHRHGDLLAAGSAELLTPLNDAQRKAAAAAIRPPDDALGFNAPSPEARAFDLGVRLVDARAALATDDPTVRDTAFAALADRTVDLPALSDTVDGLEAPDSQKAAVLIDLEDRLEDLPESEVPAFSLALGRFVEAARLAAAAGGAAFFEQEAFGRTLTDLRQHRLSEETRERLERMPAPGETPSPERLAEIERLLGEVVDRESR